MPPPFDQIRHPVISRRERKELLVLACEVDRLAWRKAFHPNRSPGAQLARDLLGSVDLLSSFLPSRLGRWLRSAGFLARIGRQLGWLKL